MKQNYIKLTNMDPIRTITISEEHYKELVEVQKALKTMQKVVIREHDRSGNTKTITYGTCSDAEFLKRCEDILTQAQDERRESKEYHDELLKDIEAALDIRSTFGTSMRSRKIMVLDTISIKRTQSEKTIDALHGQIAKLKGRTLINFIFNN